MSQKLVATAMTTIFLAACGGGGGDENTAVTPSPAAPISKAEGAYAGTFKSASFPNGAVQFVVLENDEVWGLYGTSSASGTIVYGVIQGQGKSDNGTFTVADGRDYFYTGQTGAGRLSAQYVAGASISGTFGANGQEAMVSATTAAAAPYSYNAPAAMSAISGAWSGTTLQGGAFTLQVSSSGSYTGNTQGCALSGTVTPRASGKNVFNMTLQFGSSPCALPGVTVNGIAVIQPQANGRNQLVVAGANSERTQGSALFATR